MLKICLVLWESEPQYAYKRYAHKKNMYAHNMCHIFFCYVSCSSNNRFSLPAKQDICCTPFSLRFNLIT